MWYVLVIIIFVASFLISCRDKIKINTKHSSSNIKIYPRENTIEKAYLTKQDIEEKLKKLSEIPIPDTLSFGAMCYVGSGPTSSASYVCPECGERTLYKLNWDNPDSENFKVLEIVDWQLKSIKQELKLIDGINLIIDESQFCKKCNPKVINPKLGLLINLENSSDTIKVNGIDFYDIRLIAEFLSGKIKHIGYRDEETPLVYYLDKLQTFFGTKLDLPEFKDPRLYVVPQEDIIDKESDDFKDELHIDNSQKNQKE